MRLKEKKLAVLHHLSEEAEPISLNALLNKLGVEYTARSVRRWLAEMVNKGLVEKTGDKRGTKYQVIRREKREAGTMRSCFGVESLKLLQLIHRPIYERQPVAYIEEWLEEYQPNITFYIPLESRIRLEKAGKRCRREDPAGTYAHQIFNRLLIDLSYNSSRLEGNTYSLLDTERLLIEGSSAEGKLEEEKIMILNHKEAIRYLVDNAPRLKISEETICTLHYLLADGLVEAKYAGKLRDHPVRIGGSTYIPFEEKRQLQQQLVRILEKGAVIENPYEQSLFLLAHISYLQGFADVNKRTARLCANIPLIKNNLVPLSFNDVEREDYSSALIALYELQRIQPLLDLYQFSYMRTCAQYDSTIKAMGFDEMRVRYRQQRRAILRELILRGLVGEAMQNYIQDQTNKLIKEEDRFNFLEDLMEDIREIDAVRIAGLGVTLDQLNGWIQLSGQKLLW
jgi:fido (protein-threonine AMPylation protein)